MTPLEILNILLLLKRLDNPEVYLGGTMALAGDTGLVTAPDGDLADVTAVIAENITVAVGGPISIMGIWR
jgi:hypothetical protein